eukprot:3349530-Pleurochrysis_carterae.AAC.2
MILGHVQIGTSAAILPQRKVAVEHSSTTLLTVTSRQRARNSKWHVRISDALKVGPPGPFWIQAAPKRATPKGGGGGRHLGRASFTMK